MHDRLPRLTAKEAEKILLDNGFSFVRQKGSHRIYRKKRNRMILSFHGGKILHPKIVKELPFFRVGTLVPLL
jgi:predicted RNA binding protein YcfA (HicA-like mRNA interferase family)